VLEGDALYGAFRDLAELPPSLLDRLRHYFLTYKQAPDRTSPEVEITHVYGRAEAEDAIRRSQEDYRARYGALAGILEKARRD
jgi:inorganic pyrophosphatase